VPSPLLDQVGGLLQRVKEKVSRLTQLGHSGDFSRTNDSAILVTESRKRHGFRNKIFGVGAQQLFSVLALGYQTRRSWLNFPIQMLLHNNPKVWTCHL
jgi:hypothetical protein